MHELDARTVIRSFMRVQRSIALIQFLERSQFQSVATGRAEKHGQGCKKYIYESSYHYSAQLQLVNVGVTEKWEFTQRKSL